MNAFGAAFILPIYCFRHVRANIPEKNTTLKSYEARALLITIAISATFPLILMLPPILSCTVETQQGYLAIFQVTPLLFAGIQVLASLFLRGFQATQPEDANESNQSTRSAYLFACTIASLAHLSALGASIFTRNAELSFSRVFLPWYTHVDQSSPNGQGLVMGAHLFTQFDSLIIGLTCAVYAFALIEPLLKKRTLIKYEVSNKTSIWAAVIIAITTVVLGPAAVVSFAFVMREANLSVSNERKTR
jgi:hypothetical protein